MVAEVIKETAISSALNNSMVPNDFGMLHKIPY